MLKPGVNRLVHLFAAPFLWTSIGVMLIIRGIAMLESRTGFVFLCAGIAAGVFKSVMVLDKVAIKAIDRIISLQDGTCLGAVFSWKTWGLVCCMMGMGVVIRTFFSPNSILGSCYLAIGWALLFSSRHGWSAWMRELRRV